MMLIVEDSGAKRSEVLSLDFADSKDGIAGYATNWFFYVHSAFKAALDIFHVERINNEKTLLLRDKNCVRLYGITHQHLKERLVHDKVKLGESPEHAKVMAYMHKDIIETEGSPQMYAFRQNDSLESRDGQWFLQVTQAKPRTSDDEGQVGFTLYRRASPPHDELSAGMWRKDSWHVTDQAKFVAFLRTGSCQALSLKLSASRKTPCLDAATGGS